MAEIIHLAAPSVTFGNICRQRCAWCGALIGERDRTKTGIPIDPEWDEEETQRQIDHAWMLNWQGLVAVEGGARWKVEDPPDGRAPERSCMVLMPEEIGVV